MSRRTRLIALATAITAGLASISVGASADDRLRLPDSVDAVAVNDTSGPGCTKASDAYLVRSLSGATTTPDVAARLAQATPILRFGDLSDTHVIDDDGPDAANGTVTEVVLDPAIGNTSATFLTEEYTDEVLDGMIRRLNGCDLDLAVTTGDITDTNWLNVARRVIDNVNGSVEQSTAFERTCGYTLHADTDDPRLIDGSDCPIPAELLAIPTGRLVADADQGELQGDTSAGHEGPDVADDPTYSFNTTRALRQALDSAATAAANGSSNIAAGLPPAVADDNAALDLPFYAAFGNHDAIVKGTVTYQKPMGPALATFGRYFLESKRQFINEWLVSDDDGFGFAHVDTERMSDTNDQNDGYYAFDVPLATGGTARFIILDTTWSGVDHDLNGDGATAAATGGLIDGGEATNPTGLEAGYMDRAQFDWLAGELAAADSADMPVFAFSHHPDRTFIEHSYDGTPQRVDVTSAELDQLLGSHDNVMAWIAGHTHANRIHPCATTGCLLGSTDISDDIDHGFWRFETASLIDWPQEGRVVELFDLADLNADGDATTDDAIGTGIALRLTMISADQDAHDGIVGQSRTLSGYEAMCTTAGMSGGTIMAGSARPDTFAMHLLDGDHCPDGHAVSVGAGTPAGALSDRDVILLP